jgi:hypothetical protein
MLRCAHCGNQWQYVPPPQEVAPREVFNEPMPLPEPEPPPPPLRAPVSFVPEPTPTLVAKRKIPIPGMPVDDPKEQYNPASKAPLTYGTRSYAQAEDLPVPQRAKKGASPWLISILILLLAAGIVWIERFHIMQVWPPSARLFDAISGFLGHK